LEVGVGSVVTRSVLACLRLVDRAVGWAGSRRLGGGSRPCDPAVNERGQTVAVFALFMLSVIAMAGLVIDVGHWYQDKQAVQAEVDAAALAGAASLPSSWSTAVGTASAQLSKNGRAGDIPTYSNTTNQTPNDSVTVSVTRQSRTFFTTMFGLHSVPVTATAQATVQSFSTVASNRDVMPWGVMKNSFTPGQPYNIYTDNSSSNNGALSLPYVNNANCPVPNGANPYRDEIDGNLNACPISIDEMLDVKPGQNAGPTRQGIAARITTWQPLNQIVSYSDPAHATILNAASKQLVLIPIVEDPNGGTNWLNGSGQVRVIGFAWFVITGPPGYTNNGKTVTGTFVGLEDTVSTGDTTGAWNPQSGQNLATSVLLTK
jgi:Flp pilus assembly protein TadG